MRTPSRVIGCFVAALTLFTARVALGAPARIHTVFWQQDTSVQADVDAFSFGGGSSAGGCGCVLTGGPSTEASEALVILVGLLLASLRWMRRNGGAD